MPTIPSEILLAYASVNLWDSIPNLRKFSVGNISGRYVYTEFDDKSYCILWFDGSNDRLDWEGNLKLSQISDKLIVPYTDNSRVSNWDDHLVHLGFMSMYRQSNDEIRRIVYDEFFNFVQHHDPDVIAFAGHSLGGAITQLAARDFMYHRGDLVSDKEIHLVTFGAPRVGNIHFVRSLKRVIPNGVRVIKGYDVVPSLPIFFFRYRHAYGATFIGRWPSWIRKVPGIFIHDHFMDRYRDTLYNLVFYIDN